MNTCPNCGAQIVGDKCEYCGTVFRNEQENIYLRAKTLYQIERLDTEKQALEFKLAHERLMDDLRQNLSECCERRRKRWWKR